MLNPSVIELLKERKRSGSTPNTRTDPHTIGLAIEGGGMRGAGSVGMLAALHHWGYLNCVDSIAATSAGAVGMANFIAGQGVSNASIYPEFLATSQFINKFKIIRRKSPLMDLNFLFDVISNQQPVHISKVLQSPIKAIVVATELATGRAIPLSDFDSKQTLLAALRASATIPQITTITPTRFKDMCLVDGGFSALLPLKIAQKNATHVLALSNVPKGKTHLRPGRIDIHLVSTALRKFGSPIAEKIPELHQQNNAELKAIRQSKNPRLALCEMPEGTLFLNTLCNTPNLIWGAIENGFAAMSEMLDHPKEAYPAVWNR